MKRFFIMYSNGMMEQCSTIDATIERQISTGVVSYVVDTEHGVVVGKVDKQVKSMPIPDANQTRENAEMHVSKTIDENQKSEK